MDIYNLLQYFVPVILCFTTKRAIDDYKVNREYHHVQSNNVILPTNIEKEFDGININDDILPEFMEYAKIFCKTLTSSFESNDLVLLSNNIRNFNIKEKSYILAKIIHGVDIYGEYFIDTNDIILAKNERLSIFHELFHLASSYYDNEICYSGFSQTIDAKTFGESLNEGYTEIMTKRYFKDYYEDKVKSYVYEQQIASLLETIVTRRKMEQLYLNANLFGLIEYLSNYISIDRITDFIAYLDFIGKHIEDEMTILKKIMLNNALRNVITFLIDCYASKLNSDIGNLLITQEEAYQRFMEFVSNISTSVTCNDNTFNFFNDDEYVTMLNNILDTLNVKNTR